MFYRLQRHPLPIQAFFRHSLVLTYAYPEALLAPLLPPGLTLDSLRGVGFLAIAAVQTEDLRPAGLPTWLGRDFLLCGYRIFSRFRDAGGRTLRGLRILRSDTDKWTMAHAGNLLTHYNYQHSVAKMTADNGTLRLTVRSAHGEADLDATADLRQGATLPTESVFRDWHEARRFAGPLPFTFDYEKQTHSIIVIKGVRSEWNPRPVAVMMERNTFLDQPPFKQENPRLVSAFYLSSVPYRWERGVLHPLVRQPA